MIMGGVSVSVAGLGSMGLGTRYRGVWLNIVGVV